MLKQIDVSDLPDPLIEAIESMVRTYRERATKGALYRPIEILPTAFFSAWCRSGKSDP